MKNSVRILLICSCVICIHAAHLTSQERQKIAKANSKMKVRNLMSVTEASELYKDVLRSHPEDNELKLKTADSINAIMRIKTNGNALLIEGTSDTPENKAIWASLGPEAFALAKDAYSQKPNDAFTLSVYTDAYMFVTSSKGIITQALTGAGSEFKRLATELITKHPSWDSGVGNVLLGAFYLLAPWPLGSKDLAMSNMNTAAKLAPSSRRNLYYIGVVAYRRGEFARAAEAFAAAVKAPCGSKTEEDFGEFMLEQSARGLELARRRLPAGARGQSKSGGGVDAADKQRRNGENDNGSLPEGFADGSCSCARGGGGDGGYGGGYGAEEEEGWGTRAWAIFVAVFGSFMVLS